MGYINGCKNAFVDVRFSQTYSLTLLSCEFDTCISFIYQLNKPGPIVRYRHKGLRNGYAMVI